MLPSSYDPKSPDQFIGPARKCAVHVTALAKLLRQSPDPFRVVFSGPPGVGKSKLASYLLAALGGAKWNLTKLNGTQVKLEEVEAVARDFQFRDLLGDYRFLWIEELDQVPHVARSRLLTLCDDMPPKWGLVGTTNLKPDEFKKLHPATQRRYSFLEVAPPSADEIFALLRQHWPQIPEASVRQIAVFACGCVGAALQEADNHFVNALSQIPEVKAA